MPVQVQVATDHHVVRFAAEELVRFLPQACRDRGRLEGARFVLGLGSDIPTATVPAVPDQALDDAYQIEAAPTGGWIAGSNPRSVLLAVYRFLTELGCRWLRPGPDGFLAGNAPACQKVSVCEAASYRHRGLCIEGACSENHVLQMLEWLPRVGMNSYFTQFREAYTFFERWYGARNSDRPAEPLTVADARGIMARVAEQIDRRGLAWHAVGHGWTCEPFGMEGLGWEYPPVKAPEWATPYLAEVAGKRQVWEGIPLNTNLCYSNPTVRDRIVEDILAYLKSHPRVDLLHFWLADGANNNCECEGCRDTLPSDFYVAMLNQVDASLSALGIATRIVFLIYVDLLWPPIRERLRNPDRFVLMFAPITRSYSASVAPQATGSPLPPFTRNHLQFPRNVQENVAFLRSWQDGFAGDSFDFDYHYMWDHFRDPGYMQQSAVLHQDVASLGEIGLNGLISCQTQRTFLPTGVGMVAMARTLWNRNASFDEITADYFQSAFGPAGLAVRDYLAGLSARFDPVFLRGERPEDAQPAFAQIPAYIDTFGPIIKANLAAPIACQAASWRYLGLHAELCTRLALALSRQHDGSGSDATAEWREVARYAREHELDMDTVFDVYLFIDTLVPRQAR